MAKQTIRYLLTQDDSCHWIIIPVEKKEEFNKWMHSEDYENGYSPEWVHYIGSGTEAVTFTDPEIFGKKYLV